MQYTSGLSKQTDLDFIGQQSCHTLAGKTHLVESQIHIPTFKNTFLYPVLYQLHVLYF